MNGLNSLRRRDIEIDPLLGPIFPNVPGPPPPQIPNISQPQGDETGNSLLNLMKIIQSLKGQPATQEEKESTQPDEEIYRSNYKEQEDKYWAMVESMKQKDAMNTSDVYSPFYNPPLATIPSRRAGGPVKEDQPYRVGEEGPEVFIPTPQNFLLNIMKIIQSLKGQPAQGNKVWEPGDPTTEAVVPTYGDWSMPNSMGYDSKSFMGSSYSGPDFPGGAIPLTSTPLLSKDPYRAREKPIYPGGKEWFESRQRGGPIVKGKPYLVGEEGEEVIIPQEDGTVIPSSATTPNLTENTLRNLAMTNPNLSFKNFITPTTEMPPSNALLRATAPPSTPETKKPTNALLDYWAKPVIGGIPRDMFVQLAGSLAHAIAPREWSGRIGANLAQMGGAAYAERVKREGEELERQRKEPENVLRRRLLEAQIGEAETPKEWGAFSKSLRGMEDPDTKRPYTEGKILQKFHEATRVPKEPKEPQYDIDIQQDPTTQKWQHGRRNKSTGVFTADRPATPTEIESKVTGKIEEAKAPTLNYQYENIKGVPHQRQIEWDAKTGKWIPKGDWIRREKPEKPEKLSIGDARALYLTRISGIKTRMTIDMSPEEQAGVTGETTGSFMDRYFAGKIGKSLTPIQREQYRKEVLDAETEFNELSGGVLGRKGVITPPKVIGATPTEKVAPDLLTDIIYEGSKARGKIVPRAIVPEKIFKDTQGREMVKDPSIDPAKLYEINKTRKARGEEPLSGWVYK